MPGKATTGEGVNPKTTRACTVTGEGLRMRTNMFALVHQFGMDKVNEIMARTEIPSNERIEAVWQAIDAANPTYELVDFNEDEYVFVYEEEMGMNSKSDGEDKDELDEIVRKVVPNLIRSFLGEEKDSVIVKRPHAPIECEQECKKPRIAEGSGCQGEELETENLPRV